MQWPVLPTQPDGEQPGLLLPPPPPWDGEPLPEAVTRELRTREVPIWVGHPVGAPKMPWDWDWQRYQQAFMLGLPGVGLLVPGMVAGQVVATVVGGLLGAASASALIAPPLFRKRRRRQTWWVLTPDRLGLLCLTDPPQAVWVERGEVAEVLVRGQRPDGSGTVVVRLKQRVGFPNPTAEPIDEVVIGRVPAAADLADQVGLLRYELN